MQKNKLLLIYTGGTIGMIQDPETGSLQPFELSKIYEDTPLLKRIDCEIDSYSFDPLIDSSNMRPELWVQLANVIEERYNDYDGFVVLHGTDTMAFTASMLSFMLENLAKPVVLTGSQLPLGMLRSDGRDNLISAIEIASSKDVIIPEVCIYFENRLYRGNRTVKINAENFEAFISGNYPSLAKSGIHLKYKNDLFLKPTKLPLKVYTELDSNIVILKLYPGITEKVVRTILGIEGLKAVVLETFGSGNAPTDKWFIDCLADATKKGIIIYNVTQCKFGSVDIGKYQTSSDMGRIGVVSGFDITTESAVAKLMFLLGNYTEKKKIIELLETPLRGEMTVVHKN